MFKLPNWSYFVQHTTKNVMKVMWPLIELYLINIKGHEVNWKIKSDIYMHFTQIVPSLTVNIKLSIVPGIRVSVIPFSYGDRKYTYIYTTWIDHDGIYNVHWKRMPIVIIHFSHNRGHNIHTNTIMSLSPWNHFMIN